MVNERSLRILCNVQIYQARIPRAFNKKLKVRDLQEVDLALKKIRALIQDPGGKFRPNWYGLYIIMIVLLGRAVKLMDMNGEKYTQYMNLNQLKKYYA